MKFQGSKTVVISCCQCGLESPSFRITLYEERGIALWKEKRLPEGWEIEEETELWDESKGVYYVLGYCPKHKEEDK